MRHPRTPDDPPEPGTGGSVRVPSDLSALDGLPPYDPSAVPPPPFAEGSDPVGYGDGRGTPLDLSKDPDRFDPGRSGVGADSPWGDGRGTPLDLSKDPDRFDPSAPPVPPGPLDRGLDPDRYRPPARAGGLGQTLEELLGEGTHEGERDGYEWLLGLLAVLAFLGLVAVVFSALGS